LNGIAGFFRWNPLVSAGKGEIFATLRGKSPCPKGEEK
jgi:hypothetical protein